MTNENAPSVTSEQGAAWLSLTSHLINMINVDDRRRREATERSWDLNAALVRVEIAQETSTGTTEEASKELETLVRETVACSEMYNNSVPGGSSQAGDKVEIHPRAPRLGNLSSRIEDYAQHRAYCHFLATGSLVSPSAPCFLASNDPAAGGEELIRSNILTDEEYLGGACIGLCHKLAKYAVARATSLSEDPAAIASVRTARDVAAAILEQLLKFDFRNGPLRRKYDGTKYTLKTLETVLYELSLTNAASANTGTKGSTPDESNDPDQGGEDHVQDDGDDGNSATATVPLAEIAAIRERMDHRDKLRERLIKRCRDGQKSAKQAIFALHRGDSLGASKLLKDCEDCVNNDLAPIVEEEPGLRYGSFSGVLEEYAEAKLFYCWLYGKETAAISNSDSNAKTEKDGKLARKTKFNTTLPPTKPIGTILMMNEFSIQLSAEEYIGGLCDLSGEIGRFAVARGTARDKHGVQICLETNKSMYLALKMIGRLPGTTGKKLWAVNKSVDKLKHMMYELSLIEATGRNNYASAVEENAMECDNIQPLPNED